MRAAPALRLLLLSAALLATACGDRSDFVGPEDPPAGAAPACCTGEGGSGQAVALARS